MTVPYDVAVNGEAHAEVVRAAAARVVVFPELSLTGYELDAPVVAADDSRLAPIIEACSQTESIAFVGAPVASDDGDHIAMIVVDGNGATVAYRKMWLSEAEALRFRPGDRPAVVAVDGWRLGLAICKDTGIAQRVRHRGTGHRCLRGGRARFSRRRHHPGPASPPGGGRAPRLGGGGELRGVDRWRLRACRRPFQDLVARWHCHRQRRP